MQLPDKNQDRTKPVPQISAIGPDANLMRALRHLAQPDPGYAPLIASVALIILLSTVAAATLISKESQFLVLGLIFAGLIVSAGITWGQLSLIHI